MKPVKRIVAACAATVVMATGLAIAAPAATAAPSGDGVTVMKPVERIGHVRLVQDVTQAKKMQKKAKVALTSIAPAHDQNGTGGHVEKLPIRKVKGQMLLLDGGIKFESLRWMDVSYQCREPIVHVDTRNISCQIPGKKNRQTTFKIVSTPQMSVKGKTTYVNNMMIAIANKKVANTLDRTFDTNYFNEGMVIGVMNAIYKTAG